MSENQLKPELGSVNINLNIGPYGDSPPRLYMMGGNISKAVTIDGATPRRNISGFESQYGSLARSIQAPSNMSVEGIFYQRSVSPGPNEIDDWATIYVVFYNEEEQKYDLLTMPKYNTQNSYIAFEYKYDHEIMRKLKVGATFPKGTLFAKSPRISESGEWMFGGEFVVACMTDPATEEDGIIMTEAAAIRLGTIFANELSFSYNDDEYVPLNLYGTLDNPAFCPQNGESVRPDGIVMGFRRRDTSNALASLTKKQLMIPDENYDKLFYASPDNVCSFVEVTSDRTKNRSNNRSVEKLSQPHTKLLEEYEKANNKMWNEIKKWYYSRLRKQVDSKMPMTGALWTLVYQSLGNITYDYDLDTYSKVKRSYQRRSFKDWNIKITLKEKVLGKPRFKVTGCDGNKNVIVKVIPTEHAPVDEYGRRAEFINNNSPAFRRQIFTMLVELSLNFYSINVFDKAKSLYVNGDYAGAWKELYMFYEASSPELAKIFNENYITDDDRYEHVDYVMKSGMISTLRRSDSSIWGGNLVSKMSETYKQYKPTRVTYVNSFGKEIKTIKPILVSTSYYMLLDKFGTDMSCQSFPKLSIFSMPAKLTKKDQHSRWHRDNPNRNQGETEVRLRNSQSGTCETVKMLTTGNSPTLINNMVKRLIRSNDPLNIARIVRPEEYAQNRSIQLAVNILSDSGFKLRKENEKDRTDA